LLTTTLHGLPEVKKTLLPQSNTRRFYKSLQQSSMCVCMLKVETVSTFSHFH